MPINQTGEFAPTLVGKLVQDTFAQMSSAGVFKKSATPVSFMGCVWVSCLSCEISTACLPHLWSFFITVRHHMRMRGLPIRVRLTACRISGAFQWCPASFRTGPVAGCASAVQTLPTAGQEPHTPVLLPHVLEAFSDVNLKVHVLSCGILLAQTVLFAVLAPHAQVCCVLQVHVDCTLGAGGHAEAVIRHHPVRALLT